MPFFMYDLHIGVGGATVVVRGIQQCSWDGRTFKWRGCHGGDEMIRVCVDRLDFVVAKPKFRPILWLLARLF